jgi:predicted naringenin-chalcone synthase
MTNTLERPSVVTVFRGAESHIGLARVVGQAHVTPPPMDQTALWTNHYSGIYGEDSVARKIWAATGISTRHGVVNPANEDISQWSTGQRMERYLREAMPLGTRAVGAALAESGIDPGEIGLFSVVSCTGYATPGLDIRISHALGMSPDVQRLVVGHMGCYAAIPGLGAVSDYVAARGKPAVMLCIELTSLHPQPVTPGLLAGTPTEEELEQMVAHAIFADAASAIVLAPTTGPADPPAGLLMADTAAPSPRRSYNLEVVDVTARTDWSTQGLMRWDVTDFGFRMRLSAKVPAILAEHVRGVVDEMLATHGFTIPDVAAWAVHPGGRKILEVVQDRLNLPPGALDASYSVLRDYGNCSSPTVLLVLERLLAMTAIPSGAPVVMMAFGPGLTLYTALLLAT